MTQTDGSACLRAEQAENGQTLTMYIVMPCVFGINVEHVYRGTMDIFMVYIHVGG